MLSKSEMEKISEMLDTQTKNDLFLQICSAYLNECETLVTADIIRDITAGEKSGEERAFSSFLAKTFIEDERLCREMLSEYFFPSVKRLDPEAYKNDPYFKNIPISQRKIGSWTLFHQSYAPYEGFVRDDYILDGEREICALGFFDTEFSFPTVFENGVEWMAIKPNEIETMKRPIEMASGRVVTFGLGLGYFAYMASIKDSVSSVTVIERSEDVISLFKSEILPHFSHPEKIKIIQSDAFEYAKNQMSSEAYDYAFVDLWRDVSDGVELYSKMKKLEALSKETHFEYWIEKSILLAVRKRIFNAIIKSIESGKNTLSYNEILQRLSFDYLKELVKLF